MITRSAGPMDDDALAGSLRELAEAIDWPVASVGGGPDLALRVRVRLVSDASRPAARPWWRPARRALILALAALLALAAIAGAIGLGLPGLHLSLVQPSTPPPTFDRSRSPAPGAPGSTLGLGKPVTLEAAATLVGRPIPVPGDPAIGPPDAVYVDTTRANQVALVWRDRADLPHSLEPGVGLVLMAFDGLVDDSYYEKMLGSDSTVEPVTVKGHRGLWIAGAAHFFFYRRPSGEVIDDPRRWVGDALVWSDGVMTYRLETALGKAAAIRIAESLR
jgi:hypothetical protein